MQFKKFMEELKGKQHKLDKNKNGKLDAHDFKLLRKEEQELVSEGAYEKAEEKAEENKRSADAAKKQGDMFAHHLHMADHHDNMAEWHSSRGRHSVADSHMEKSEEHHAQAMKLKEEVELDDAKVDQGLSDDDKVAARAARAKANNEPILNKGNTTGGQWRAKSPSPYKDSNVAKSGERKGMITKSAIQRTKEAIKGRLNKEEVELDEGMQQKLRKYVPGYAKRQIDKKMDDQKFGRTDVDKDANYWRYKKVQDKLKKEEVELEEAKSPQQKADFDRMMAGAMSRAAYNAKWKKPLKSDDKVIYGKNVKEETQLDEADYEARADYKLDKSGKKYHKQIEFKDGSNDDANEKHEVREETDMNEEMTDAQMKKREDYVKGMKKNIAGFKSKYGERAKEVMYATATKMAMKEETIEEAAGQHKVMVTVSDPNHTMVSQRKEQIMKRVIVNAETKDHAVAKAKEFYKKKGYKVHDAEYHSAQPKSTMKTEEATLDEEQLDERNKENAIRRKMMDASRGARWKVQNKVSGDDVRDWDGKHKTAQAQNKAIGRALRNEESDLEESVKPGETHHIDWDGKSHVYVNKVEGDNVHLTRLNRPIHKDKSQPVRPEDKIIMSKKEFHASKLKKEEVELDELNKSTLASYVKKSSSKQFAAGHKAATADSGTEKAAIDKAQKRSQGVAKAVDRLTREETEIEEQAPVAPVPGDKWKDHAVMVNGRQRVVISRANKKNYPEHEGWKEVSPGHKVKEDVDFDEEGNLMAEKKTYAQFMEQLLEYESKDGRYVHTKGSYGKSYQGDDDDEDGPKKKPAEPAVKRGRGRPAGSKSGANQKVTSGKSYGGIAYHSLNLPNTK